MHDGLVLYTLRTPAQEVFYNLYIFSGCMCISYSSALYLVTNGSVSVHMYIHSHFYAADKHNIII